MEGYEKWVESELAYCRVCHALLCFSENICVFLPLPNLLAVPLKSLRNACCCAA